METFYPGEGPAQARRRAQQHAGRRRASRPGSRGEPLDLARMLYARRQAAAADLLPRPPRRRPADVLPDAAAGRGAELDAQAAGHDAACGRSCYFDEVFGYLPPHPANPPTKPPLMTLLKQARAFGVGVLLATQNPVDLDYKALSQRRHLVRRQAADRARQGPAARGAGGRGGRARHADRPGATWRRSSPPLGNRVFLLHDVHQRQADAVPEPLGPVVPARADDARPDRRSEGLARTAAA